MSPEIPYAEQVQNIQEIKLCVQRDSSTFSSTRLYTKIYCRTACTLCAFLRGLSEGLWGWGERGDLSILHLDFVLGFFLKEMDYV